MFRLKLVPAKTSLRFMERRKIAFALSVLLILGSVVMYFGQGLNRGIDFEGGILVEVKTEGPADLAAMRSLMSGLGLGQVALQEFGAPDDVLIRVERQPGGAELDQQAPVDLSPCRVHRYPPSCRECPCADMCAPIVTAFAIR